jgi:hypothetical protein
MVHCFIDGPDLWNGEPMWKRGDPDRCICTSMNGDVSSRETRNSSSRDSFERFEKSQEPQALLKNRLICLLSETEAFITRLTSLVETSTLLKGFIEIDINLQYQWLPLLNSIHSS